MSSTTDTKKKKKRRSSILKKSPSRTALSHVDFNSELTEIGPIASSKYSKRVSFAETDQIKEFNRSDRLQWQDSSLDDNRKLDNLSNLLGSLPKRPSIPSDFGSQGIHSLLSAPIVDERSTALQLNETVGSCDMDVTNISVSDGHIQSQHDKSITPNPCIPELSAPRTSFFDNSKLGIGDPYLPTSPTESGPEKLQGQLMSLRSLETSDVEVTDVEPLSKPVNFREFLQSIKTSQNLYVKPSSADQIHDKGSQQEPVVGGSDQFDPAQEPMYGKFELKQSHSSSDGKDLATEEEDVPMDFTECKVISNPLSDPNLPSSMGDEGGRGYPCNTEDCVESVCDMEMTCMTTMGIRNIQSANNEKPIPDLSALPSLENAGSNEDTNMEFTCVISSDTTMPNMNAEKLDDNHSAKGLSLRSEFYQAVSDVQTETSTGTKIFIAGKNDSMEFTNVTSLDQRQNQWENEKVVDLADVLVQEVQKADTGLNQAPTDTQIFFPSGNDNMELTNVTGLVQLPVESDQNGVTLDVGDDKTQYFDAKGGDIELTCTVLPSLVPVDNDTVDTVDTSPAGPPMPEPDFSVPDTQEPTNNPTPFLHPEAPLDVASETLPDMVNESICEDEEEEDLTLRTISLLKRKITRARNSIGLYRCKKSQSFQGFVEEPTSSVLDHLAKREAADKETMSLTRPSEDPEIAQEDVCLASPNIKEESDEIIVQQEEKSSHGNEEEEDKVSSPDKMLKTLNMEIGFDELGEQNNDDWAKSASKPVLAGQDLFSLPSNFDDEAAFASQPLFNETPPPDPSESDEILDPYGEKDLCSPPKIPKIDVKLEESSKLENMDIKIASETIPESQHTTMDITSLGKIMEDMSRIDQSNEAENITVEEFLRDYTTSRIRNAHLKKSRHSIIVPAQTTPCLENLPDMFRFLHLVPNDITVHDDFSKSIDNKEKHLKKSISATEEKLSAANPELFNKIRFGDAEESEKLVGLTQKLASLCKSLGKAYWKRDESKLLKGLCQSAEMYIEDGLTPLVEKIGNSHDLLDASLQEIEKANKILDEKMAELENIRPPTEQQALHYEAHEKRILEIDAQCEELRAKNKCLKHMRSEFEQRQKTLVDLVLKDKTPKPKVSKNSKKQEALSLHEKYTPWKLKDLSDKSIQFSFLYDSLLLYVESEEKLCASSRAKITYKYESCLGKDTVVPQERQLFELIHKLVRSHLPQEHLAAKYGQYNLLSQALEQVSFLCIEAKDLIYDIDYISSLVESCFCRVSPAEFCVTVTFLPPMVGLDRFSVKFFYHCPAEKNYQSEKQGPALVDCFRPVRFEYIPGRRQMEYLGNSEIEEIMKAIPRGTHALMRMVNALLEKIN